MPALAIGKMNKDLFYKQIDQPELLSASDIDSLVELVDQYPYFASARVLLAKALHAANDHRFEDALQQAAVFAGDRKVLYNLIMRESLTQKIKDLEDAVEADTEDDDEWNEEDVVGEKITQAEATETEGVEEKEQSRLEEEPVLSEGDEDKTEQDQDDKKSGEENYDDLEQEILYEAINSSISQEVSLEEEEIDHENRPESKEERVVEVEEELPTSDELEDEQPTTYAGWLKKRARQIQYYQKTGIVEEPSKKRSPGANENLSAGEKSDSKQEDEKPRQDKLIEQFIEKEPKITPGKVDMFSSENLAKMSIVEDETFVTETMARIFARQGNIRKAKKAYKLLSLKYPEKSIYFANQIKKLQGKK